MKKNKIVYTTLVGDNFNEGHKKVIKKANDYIERKE